MEKEKIRMSLKLIGIVGFIVGILSFIISFAYMNEAITFGTIGALAKTIFFGLFGTTTFISGTIVYIKSMDFITY